MIEQVLPKAKSNHAKKENFAYTDPKAESVSLAGDFTDWEQNPIAMKKQKGGVWKATVSLEPGVYEYRFLVDGEWRDDADCPQRRQNDFGAENCIRKVS